MTTRIQKSVLVDVAVSAAYGQWTRFEQFPEFMGGVERVTRLGDDRLEWVAEIAGVRRQWTAEIVEQVPDRKVAWAAVEGATNAGAVAFQDAGSDRTVVNLTLEFEPEGFLEQLGDKLHLVERQAEHDLDKFKSFVESQAGRAGGWHAGAHDSDEHTTYAGGRPENEGSDDDLDLGIGLTGTRRSVDPVTETDPEYRRQDDILGGPTLNRPLI